MTAISDIVQPVSDQCLAKGLIPDSVYKRVLESGGTSEDKAKTLILAVKTSTESDSRCFEILLRILEKHVTFPSKKKLLTEMRQEFPENVHTVDKCRVSAEELPRESGLLLSSFLEKHEDSIRQHEQACTEENHDLYMHGLQGHLTLTHLS